MPLMNALRARSASWCTAAPTARAATASAPPSELLTVAATMCGRWTKYHVWAGAGWP
jgi:hypothetical protein